MSGIVDEPMTGETTKISAMTTPSTMSSRRLREPPRTACAPEGSPCSQEVLTRRYSHR